MVALLLVLADIAVFLFHKSKWCDCDACKPKRRAEDKKRKC